MRFPLGRRDLRAWSLYLALTVPFGIVAHLGFDLADAGLSWSVLLRPAHLALLALVLAAASGAAFGLGAGLAPAERRRRLAVVRASLRADRSPLPGFSVGAVAQAMIAAATLSLDDAALNPDRLVLAVLAGLLAVVAGAFALRLARRRVLDLALRAPRLRRSRAAVVSVPEHAVPSGRLCSLFRPNRAPPLVTASI